MMRTYKIHAGPEAVDIEADKIEFYQVVDSTTTFLILSVDGQIVAVFKNWDFVI